MNDKFYFQLFLGGVDFVGIEEQLVTFEPGVLTQAVSISLSDDSQQEETELFTVHLEEAPDSLLRVLIETPTAFVLINDDDCKRLLYTRYMHDCMVVQCIYVYLAWA